MLIADSFIGTGAALEGSAVEGSSVGPLTWSLSFTGFHRQTGGASPVSGDQAQGYLSVPYAGSGVETAQLFDFEAEFSRTGSTSNNSVQLSVEASGFSGMFGPSSAGGRITSYPDYTEYGIFAGSFAPTAVYSDTVVRPGYVNRRMVINYDTLTYECYADGAVINSGSFSSTLTAEPLYRDDIAIRIYADRRESLSTAFVRNMQVSVLSLDPPGAFWTDFVFAYEAV